MSNIHIKHPSLTIKAGRRAMKRIREQGLSPIDVGIIPGAAGGPKALGIQGLDLALGGRGVDQSVGSGQSGYAVDGGVGVIDGAVEWGGRCVVFLGHLGAVTDLGYQLLLWVEVVGHLGLKLPDFVE